ncbi:MAG TPA: glutathione S-transferase family protein [Candidatus Binataceae bacterium]|nr:glutathione S-transferase family protein [Candidatus Binataceae bacterium]
MKLYNMNLSNFATKCRIVIYDKGAKVDIVPVPNNDSKSPEYLKINPLGKVPAFDADGLMIAESEVINEYLEDKFPNPPLMPQSPEGRARVRTFTRFHDLYLEPPLRALFGQMNPKTRDDKVVNDKLTELNGRLDQLDKMLSDGGFACGSDFTLADCALAPTMFFAVNLVGMFGAKPPLEARPKIAAWWTHVQTRPSVKKALGEMAEALAAMNRGAR